MQTEKCTEIYWDGPDLITQLSNGQTWHFTEAYITDIKVDDEWSLISENELTFVSRPILLGDTNAIDT
jgi:hypothetical protein